MRFAGAVLLVAISTAAAQDVVGDDGFITGLQPADAEEVAAIRHEALETMLSRNSRQWRKEAAGLSGYVKPLRTFRTTAGIYCREFEEAVVDRNGARTATRIACRSPDGLWQIVAR